jgi:hypothetical protein
MCFIVDCERDAYSHRSLALVSAGLFLFAAPASMGIDQYALEEKRLQPTPDIIATEEFRR